MTSDEEDFASLPVINVTSVNLRGAGVDDAGTSADSFAVLDAESGLTATHGLMDNTVNSCWWFSLTIEALADPQPAESEVNTDMEAEILRSDATLEEVKDDLQPTSSQTSRRDSNAMGLVISDSISLQESMTLLHSLSVYEHVGCATLESTSQNYESSAGGARLFRHETSRQGYSVCGLGRK